MLLNEDLRLLAQQFGMDTEQALEQSGISLECFAALDEASQFEIAWDAVKKLSRRCY